MASEKPKLFQDSRDIGMTLLVIMGIAAISVAFTGLCTFNTGTPENGPVQEVDASTVLHMEARAVDFPLRQPADPEGWITNSARRGSVNGQPAVIQGWVTKEGAYLQLMQTDQPLDDALRANDSGLKTKGEPTSVAGMDFTTYTKEDRHSRDLWGADLGDVRIVLAGSADADDFAELAQAFAEAKPIEVDVDKP
ncbi:DUF4245 domain-containing protein [Corynebacterium ciconiae]|uniref:DUF4245 domain-containing protein n=1 Tax=Corynebacterium ciconiae TaxID=227319 RepID=UPI000475676B|nr:DUF4245 domain-containing protein [Corynebacterium ciconiae]